jgi:RimJ/RimL family protein N-acetyltransferase/SAM-dependent methyltransferase
MDISAVSPIPRPVAGETSPDGRAALPWMGDDDERSGSGTVNLPIAGSRVRLRDVVPGDADLIDSWTSPEAHGEFNDFGLPPSPIDRDALARGPLRNEQKGELLVERLDDDRPIGRVSWHRVGYGPNDGSAAWNMGISLLPDARGHGYGPEAQRLLADFLLATTSFDRVEASTDVENVAEQRALEKAGFIREGVLRGVQLRAGRRHDLVSYARLRSDPAARAIETVRPATPAETGDVRSMHAATRAAWDEAAERYEGWLDEAVGLIRDGGTNLFGVELELIGDLHGRCRRAIHLQCAGGRDTLSLWNLGATEVVGVDFSPRMLELARRLTQATGAPATWVLADVLDTPHELDGTADLVYTGRGSLLWLQDLDAWAAVVARLLAPRGRFVLFEGHPVEWLFDADEEGHWVATDYDYFAGPEASRGWAPEYIDRLSVPDAEQHWKFARAWTLGEVITALLGANLRLEQVAEHPVDWWGGHRDVRPGERSRIPLSFSVVGRVSG